MGVERRRVLTIDDQDRMRYECRLVRTDSTDGGPQERVVEERVLDARAVFPEHHVEDVVCLPAGCRFAVHSPAAGIDIFVVEHAPQVRSIAFTPWFALIQEVRNRPKILRTWRMTRAELEELLEKRRFALAFPYVVLCYVFRSKVCNGVYCYYRTAPLSTFDDALCAANLPNQAPNERICMPKLEEVGLAGRTYARAVADLDAAFWGSGFNGDNAAIFINFAPHGHAAFRTPWDWERASARDPLFALTARWHDAGGVTVRTFVRKRMHALAPSAGGAVFPQLLARMERAVAVPLAGAQPAAPALAPAVPAAPQPNRTEVASATIGGDTIAQGTHLRILQDDAVLHGIRAGTYRVVAVFGDGHGATFATLTGVFPLVPIAQGDTLHPSVRVCVDETDVTRAGYLRSREVTLASGTVVRVGDVLYDESNDQTLTIARFLPLSNGNTWKRMATFVGHDGRHLIEGDDGALDDGLIPLAGLDWSVPSVRLRSRTICVGDYLQREVLRKPYRLEAISSEIDGFRFMRLDGETEPELLSVSGEFNDVYDVMLHLEVAPDGSTVTLGDDTYTAGVWCDQRTGDVLDIVRFSAAMGGPGDVHAVTRDGLHVSVIEDWEYALENDYDLVETSVGVRGIGVTRGNLLRLRSPVGEHTAGMEFTVAYVKKKRKGTPSLVVFDCGLGFPFTYGNATLFERATDGDWAPLAGDPSPLAEMLGERGANLRKGVRVAYVGGDFQFRNDALAAARRTRGTIVARNERRNTGYHGGKEQRWTVEFDEAFPGLHDCNGTRTEQRYAYIVPHCLAAITSASSLATEGFTRVFFPKGEAILIRPGHAAGRDYNGKELHVGDTVRHVPLDKRRFTIAHAVAGSGQDYPTLYLDAGHAFGGYRPPVLAGVSLIPPSLRENADWWSRIKIAQSSKVVLVAKRVRPVSA